jgi:hypothetical protein
VPLRAARTKTVPIPCIFAAIDGVMVYTLGNILGTTGSATYLGVARNIHIRVVLKFSSGTEIRLVCS